MENLTEERKKEIVAAYVGAEPTPENSIEIVKELAEKFGRTPNSIRMILSKEDVYVKKAPAPKAEGASTGTKRVSKADSIAALKETLEEKNLNVDDDIIDKMTGKAAVYFTDLIKSV